MKILINGRFLTQKVTGVQRTAYEILKQLDILLEKPENNDVSFEILTPYNFNEKDIIINLKNIKIKKLSRLNGHLWEQFVLPFYSFNHKLINFCNTAPLFKRKQIVYLYDAAVFSRPEGYSKSFVIWYRFLFRVLSLITKRIITVSHFSKLELIKYIPMIEKKIIVSYLGSDHIDPVKDDDSILEKYKIKKNQYFFAVSSLNPNKNFKIILNALKKIKMTNIQVVIAGGTNNKVFSSSGRINDENIITTGYVSDNELKTLYKNARCFIFPSIYEGFGLPPLESMRLGTPVLASNAASIPEICGEAAIYFNPQHADDLIDAINKVEFRRINIEDLIIKGKERSEIFNWSKTANDLLNVIREDL
jgi:glycosyltransferase involved in cell wall biosynthesis